MHTKLVSRFGFWSSILSTIFLGGFAIAFTVAVIAFP
jgi:hypothetical protein